MANKKVCQLKGIQLLRVEIWEQQQVSKSVGVLARTLIIQARASPPLHNYGPEMHQLLAKLLNKWALIWT
ncbi:hypothetical protein HYC85_013847 [Camellia sinensis]|uniref:Uncharacterized protein n=1 Tax=Camellia sinensis TaxID=4442 RepID=A0A7J7H4J1_CAMSI|nr:hypothetical protein HYC85_013847 [Camellia sinensis]